MNILYFGDKSIGSTSLHRCEALRRLGHCVEIYTPQEIVNTISINRYLGAIHYRTGYMLLQKLLLNWIGKIVENNAKTYDLVWVDSGEYFGQTCLKKIRQHYPKVVLFNVDDPTGKRDGNRFYSLIQSLKHYDLVVCVRKETNEELRNLKCKNVLKVWRSYDELMHRPYENVVEIPEKFKSEVAFIGTWMRNEKRDEFLLALAKNGIPISIWGGRWEKSAYWNELKQFYKGGSLSGKDYVAAIQGAKICLGFLSKGNRDLHTQRSLEIPYIGGLFCAERTSEHLELYNDFEEAVFWNDVNECAELCKKLLADNDLRESIRIAGMRKVRSLNVGNEDICRRVIDVVDTIVL